VQNPFRASSFLQITKDLASRPFGAPHAPTPCGRNGATNEHHYPRFRWGASCRRTTGPPHDRNPSLFTASWPGSPGNRRPRRTGGFHLRRASAPLPVGRTVFEIAVSLCQWFAQTPPQTPHPRVPPHRHPGSPPPKVRKVGIPRKGPRLVLALRSPGLHFFFHRKNSCWRHRKARV